jgi:hypothetical protein
MKHYDNKKVFMILKRKVQTKFINKKNEIIFTNNNNNIDEIIKRETQTEACT